MKLTHRRLNNSLSLVVIGFGLYIVLSPFIPAITFAFQDKSPEARAPYSGELALLEGSSTQSETPQENRIVIPSIQIDEPVLEGNSITTITDGGTWRRPATATPNSGNNTVIVGHRWYGNDVSTFYHLDKVKLGDVLALYWDGEEILYEVSETKVVDASAVNIESETAEKQLTIYTCDPIWTATNRLVIIANPLVSEESGVQEL